MFLTYFLPNFELFLNKKNMNQESMTYYIYFKLVL